MLMIWQCRRRIQLAGKHNTDREPSLPDVAAVRATSETYKRRRGHKILVHTHVDTYSYCAHVSVRRAQYILYAT